jgi:hypothetical protein
MNKIPATHNNTTRLVSLASACILAAMASVPAYAATSDGNWQWRATVYLWLPSIGGETSFPPSGGGPSVDVSADAILDSLNLAFMGALEARKGAWGVSTDLIYLDLGQDKKSTRNFQIGQAGLPVGVTGDLEFDMTGWLWTVAGSYALVEQDSFSLSVLGGARMLDLEEQLQWKLNGDIGPLPGVQRSGSASAKDTQWDAIVGVKGRLTFGVDRQWYVPYYLDVGAGESDLTWQAMAGLGYSFDSIDVTAAWRYLDYDLGDATPIKSIDFSGPALGVSFRF